MSGRYAVLRASRYDRILAERGYSGVAALAPFPSVAEPPTPQLPMAGGMRYDELDPTARAVIAVDRLCKPLRLRIRDGAAFLVPLEWVAAARAELGICPSCILRCRAVQRACDHDFEGHTVRQLNRISGSG